jgi:hypothetical protein
VKCNFNRLCSYLSNELHGEQRYDVVAHLHECEICLEAVSLMCKDREGGDDALQMPTGLTEILRHQQTASAGRWN